MMEAFVSGLMAVFEWPALGYLGLGVIIGIWLGAVPGLGGVTGLVLLLPFTFAMEPVPAFALLLGMYAVTATSDTITSVLLGIPGTAASQATILDGYPLAKQGQAARAFGAAFTVSAFGGVFGALILAASLPLLLPIILSFTSPELFMLAVLGLVMVGSLAGRSLAKGLCVAAFGLLLSSVGYAETLAIPRFYFGSDYLLDGIPLIPVVLGFFALPELMELAVRNTSISREDKPLGPGTGLGQGIRDAFENWWLVIRSSAIGTYIGMLPGLGAAVVDWIAYGHAVQSARDSSQFGKGDIRGVIAPEAANNAIRGGSLIPMVAFGIPGSLGTAILLGAMLIQGLTPGPQMLTDELPLTFSIIWTIVIANIFASGLLLLTARNVAHLAFLPGHLVVPGVTMFIFMGAWLGTMAMGDWMLCLSFGVLGLFMKRAGWPRPPLVLALVLGSIMENTFAITMLGYGGYNWMQRPIVLLILGLIVLSVGFAARQSLRMRRMPELKPTAGEGAEVNPHLSLVLSVAMLILFATACAMSLQWPGSVRQFVLFSAGIGALLALVALVTDAVDLRAAMARHGGFRASLRAMPYPEETGPAFRFFSEITVMVLLSLVIGQKLVLPIYMAFYLVRWGGYRWRFALGYALCGWVVLVLFYGRVMNLFWYPSWLHVLLHGHLPPRLPAWVIP